MKINMLTSNLNQADNSNVVKWQKPNRGNFEQPNDMVKRNFDIFINASNNKKIDSSKRKLVENLDKVEN